MAEASSAPFKLQSRESGWSRLRDVGRNSLESMRRPRVRNTVIATLLLLLVGGGTWGYLASRPVAKPHVLIDDLDDSLNYMLLSDEFNKLPLSERRALLKDLVKRVKGMGSEDSALMAAFAAGIMGPARDQLRKNAEKYFLDQVDEFAKEYAGAPKDKRGEFLDKKLNDLVEMMEDMGDFKLPDRMKKDIPGQAKKGAARNVERNRGKTNTIRDSAADAAVGMVNRAGTLSSPKQIARMGLFMRDMTRHLRGEDIDTGAPVPKPEPAKKPGDNGDPSGGDNGGGGAGGDQPTDPNAGPMNPEDPNAPPEDPNDPTKKKKKKPGEDPNAPAGQNPPGSPPVPAPQPPAVPPPGPGR